MLKTSITYLPLLLLLTYSSMVLGQNPIDSTTQLQEVVISIYPGKRPLFRSPATISILDERQLKQQHGFSLVPGMNSLPGVRMEERSPGSYRVSIRGSLLRSPFGIRNVKMYIDEFPLTDAGGNTYLNALDAGNVNTIEVLKGPEGSLFGANTGGVVLVRPAASTMDTSKFGKTRFHLSGGSYGLFQERISWEKQWKKYQLSVTQNFQRSDGYRENSEMSRKFFQAIQSLSYHKNARLKLLLLYSDLRYRTPGGLNLAQFNANPRAARLPTATLPGASQQQAGIINKTFFSGLTHEINITKNIRHVISVLESHTDFQNPFITNYEIRKENTIGIRTYVDMKIRPEKMIKWNWNLGMEWQQTNTRIDNYGNRRGVRDTMQASDQVNAKQYFFFTRLSAELGSRLLIEAALSLNFFNYRYQGLFPVVQPDYRKKEFDPQFLPRVAASYKISDNLVWRASASKGFSAPTIAEVRPSDNLFYTALQPESGWNYETGIRIRSNQDRFWADAVGFYYQLQNAIVRRTNEQGQEFFMNAGGTKQPGIETQFTFQIVPAKSTGLIRAFQLRNSFTYYDFSFTNYKDATTEYSGKSLTGVPPFVIVSSFQINLPSRLYLFAQHNYTDRLPLNDANSSYANGYHLIQAKAGWNCGLGKKAELEIFVGVDNLLNQKYSLGNDLNAAGNRYYNPAPKRNGYGGINLFF